MRTLAMEWADYERMLLDPIQASQTQRREMRRAFYAGAQAFFSLLTDDLSPEAELTPQDLARVEGLNQELNAFGEHVARGLA